MPPKETIVDKVRARIETGNAFSANNSKLGKELKKFIDNYEAKSLSATPRGNATRRYEEAKGLYAEMVELGYNETAATRRKPRVSLSGVSKSRKKAAASIPFMKARKSLSPILEGSNENANNNVAPLVSQLSKSRARGPMSANARAAASAKRAATMARKRNESLSNLSALFNNQPVGSATRKKRGPMSANARAAASAKRAATMARKRNESLSNLSALFNNESVGSATRKKRGPMSANARAAASAKRAATLASKRAAASLSAMNDASSLADVSVLAENLETPLMSLKKRRGKGAKALSSLSAAEEDFTGIAEPSMSKRSLRPTGDLTEEELEHVNQSEFLALPQFYNPYTGVQYAPENNPMPNIERAYMTLNEVLEKAKRKARRKAKTLSKKAASALLAEGGRRRTRRRKAGP